MSDWIRSIIFRAIMFLVALGIVLLYCNARFELEQESIVYLGPWVPTKPDWQPGEYATFNVNRRTILHGEKGIKIESKASWINAQTGEGYAAEDLIRTLTKEGTATDMRGRLLPLYIPPGDYYLDGVTETRTNRPDRRSSYWSECIHVGPAPAPESR